MPAGGKERVRTPACFGERGGELVSGFWRDRGGEERMVRGERICFWEEGGGGGV